VRPRPLALSEANLEFAELELDRVSTSVPSITSRLPRPTCTSPALVVGGCLRKAAGGEPPAPAGPVDTDGDGIPDVSDLCPLFRGQGRVSGRRWLS